MAIRTNDNHEPEQTGPDPTEYLTASEIKQIKNDEFLTPIGVARYLKNRRELTDE